MERHWGVLFYCWFFCAWFLTNGLAFSPYLPIRQYPVTTPPELFIWPRVSPTLALLTSTSLYAAQTEDSESSSSPEEDEQGKSPSLLRLAELSLKDYQWRSSFFKTTEADRRVEESLARMMGDEPSYLRPMDASEEKIGPLGLWEKSSVDWLRDVFEEEAIRAKKIIRLGGRMVRPYEAETPDGELGPLGLTEKRFIDFLDSIRRYERIRSQLRVFRPKDMDAANRGPLGNAELKAVEAIREVLDSERLRIKQSKVQETVVRPIDVPGPIGEFEMKVLEVVKAERQRAADREENPSKVVVRPMDASMKGPLGEMEAQAVAAVAKLTLEEKERLRSIQKYLDENRPMEQDKNSFFGILETVSVGIFRAPILIYQLAARINELLKSETLSSEDNNVLFRRTDDKEKVTSVNKEDQ